MRIRRDLPKKTTAPSANSPLPKPPSRLARQLALAYKIERMIDAGELRDYADASRRLGVSRARMTHVMDLMLRPVWEQEGILGGLEVAEGRLRQCHSARAGVVHAASDDERAAWHATSVEPITCF